MGKVLHEINVHIKHENFKLGTYNHTYNYLLESNN